jgi:hypothetical protein
MSCPGPKRMLIIVANDDFPAAAPVAGTFWRERQLGRPTSRFSAYALLRRPQPSVGLNHFTLLVAIVNSSSRA